MPVENNSFFKLDESQKIQDTIKMNYYFEAKYEIDVNKSELFRETYKNINTSIDLMDHFQNNENQVQVDNEGRVKMFYVLAN